MRILRVVGLMRANSLKWEDRPLWFDIYEKFPPKEEPRYDRPAPNIPIKNIFYEEDKIRAYVLRCFYFFHVIFHADFFRWFHKNSKQTGTVNLSDFKHQTATQAFIDTYKKLEDQYKGTAPEEQIYNEALDLFRHDRRSKPEVVESLSNAFQESKLKQNVNIDVKGLFKQ